MRRNEGRRRRHGLPGCGRPCWDLIPGEGYNSGPDTNDTMQAERQMGTGTSARKDALLKQVVKHLEKIQDQRQSGLVSTFAPQCYARVPFEELSDSAPGRLAAILQGQVAFMQRRRPGQLLARAYNPGEKKDGWTSDYSIVELVNDDKPFLVDSAVLTLTEMGVGLHLVVHPVVRVERSGEGELERILPRDEKGGRPESVIQLHIDRQADPSELERICNRLVAVMADVGQAVGDALQLRATACQADALFHQVGDQLGDRRADEHRARFRRCGSERKLRLHLRCRQVVSLLQHARRPP